jgi:hypothetical protein
MRSPIVSVFTLRIACQTAAFFVSAARNSPQLKVIAVGLETVEIKPVSLIQVQIVGYGVDDVTCTTPFIA